MKTFRLFSALLLVLILSLTTRAQDRSEFLTLRAKAEKGNAIAQYNLGLAYLAGTGTTANPIESFVWLSVARENGARGRALDNLVATMDRATHEAAIQRLTQFRATPGLVLTPVRAAPAKTTVNGGQPAAPSSPDQAKDVAASAAPTGAPADNVDPNRLRLEHDIAVAKLNELTGETAALRAEHERLITRAAEDSKSANDARATNAALQEQLQAANAKLAVLARTTEAGAAELLRTQQALAALEKAPKPAPDTTALEAKNRELQATLSELETSRKFGREVENTLNKVTDQKQAQEAALRVAQENFNRDLAALQAQLAAATQGKAATEQQLAELAALKSSLEQSRSKLAASEQQAAALTTRIAELEKQATLLTGNRAEVDTARQQLDTLQAELAKATAEAGRVQQEAVGLTTAHATAQKQLASALQERTTLEQEIARLRAQPVAPAYPDLSGQVRELEAQLTASQAAITAAKSAAPSYPDLSGRVTEMAAQAKDQEAAITRLTAQLVTAQSEASQAKTLLAANPVAPAYPDLSEKVQGLELQLAAAKSAAPAYPDLSDKVTTLENQVATLQADRERMQKLLADTGKKLRDSAGDPTRLKALETQATQAKNALASAESQVTSLIAERDATRKALDEQRSASTAWAQEKTQLEAALQAAQTAAPAYPNLTARVQELEAALAAKPSAPAYPDLSGKVQELEAQLAATNQQSATALSTATAQADQLRTELAAAKSAAPAYPDLSASVRTLEAQLAAANELALHAAQVASAQRQQSADELSAASVQITQLKTELTTITATSARELAASQAALTSAQNETGQAKALLAAQPTAPAYPDLTGKVGELESALAETSRQLAAANATQADTQQKLLAATTALPATAEESAGLRRERDELAVRVAGLTDEVAQLRTDRERMQKMLADAGRQMRDATADANRIKDLEAQATALVQAKDEAQAQTANAQAALAARSEAPAYPNLTDTVRALEGQVENLQAELAAKPAASNSAPTFPDLTGRVSELEAALATARDEASQAKSQLAALAAVQPQAPAPAGTPAYPDLTGRVQELETALTDTTTRLAAEQARASVASTPGIDADKLQQQLAETEDKLATALRGYALLEKERDSLAAYGNKATEALSAERNALAAQVAALSTEVNQMRSAATTQSEALSQAAALSTEKQSLEQRLTAAEARADAAAADATRANAAVAALQRSSAQNTNDLNATRALAQQLQGANSVLATENYQLKTMLSRTVTPAGPAPAVVAAPAVRTHVVASGDSLSRISQRYYGAGNRWQAIYNANRDKIGSDGVLRVGTELRIP